MNELSSFFLYAIVDLATESFRFDVFVDKRNERVHDEDREHAAFGICAPKPDARADDACADRENYLTFGIHRARYHIGEHEESSEHYAAAQNVIERIDKCFRVYKPCDTGKNKDRGKKKEGNVPRNYLFVDKEKSAEKDRERTCFTQRAADSTDEKIPVVGKLIECVKFYVSERSCSRHRINVPDKTRDTGLRPGRHRNGEADEEECSADKCRVEGMGRKGEYKKVLEDAKKAGYQRVKIDGQMHMLDETFNLDKQVKHNISIVIDRLILEKESRLRLSDSIEKSTDMTGGLVEVTFIAEDRTESSEIYSEKNSCPHCGISVEKQRKKVLRLQENTYMNVVKTLSFILVFKNISKELMTMENLKVLK